MTPLRKRMIEDMQLRNLAPETQRGYLHHITGLARFYQTSPEHLTLEDLRQYQVYLAQDCLYSADSLNQFVSAAKFLYDITLEAPFDTGGLLRAKVPHRLPTILSPQEVAGFFEHVHHLRDRTALMVAYGAGLRVSEVVALKVEDIDSPRMLLAGLAWGLLNWSRRISTTGAGAAAERRFRRRIVQLSIVCEYFLACPAWFALFQPAAAAMNVWNLALAAVIVAFTVSLMRGGQGGSHATVTAGTAPVGDRTPDACWKWGVFYVNPADPSILVEKRFGIGYTLNFGNRWTWVVLALVPIVPAAGLFLLR